MSDTGAWVVKTSTFKENIQEVLDIIAEELGRIAAGKLTIRELQFAKDKIVKSKRGQMQTSESWVDFHSFGELIAPEKYLPLDVYLNKISKSTMKDLQRVGRKYFVKGKWFLGMCGDISEEDVEVNF